MSLVFVRCPLRCDSGCEFCHGDGTIPKGEWERIQEEFLAPGVLPPTTRVRCPKQCHPTLGCPFCQGESWISPQEWLDLQANLQRAATPEAVMNQNTLLEKLSKQPWTNEERAAQPDDINQDLAIHGWVIRYRMTKHFKDLIRNLYMEAIETEDARDFTIGVQEQLKKEIESWGEKPMSAEEFMAHQERQAEKVKDMATIKRLQDKWKE